MNNHARHSEKTRLLISWLSKWELTSTKFLDDIFQTKTNSQAKFINSLVRKDVCKAHKIYGFKGKILVLGQLGKVFAMQHNNRVMYFRDNEDSFTRNVQSLTHVLACQVVAIDLLFGGEEGGSWRMIMTDKWRENWKVPVIPDMVLDSPYGDRTVIEVELHQKVAKYIYYKWWLYLEALKKQQIDLVFYYFPTEELRDKYKYLFSKSVWPIFSKGKRGLKKVGQRQPNKDLQFYFKFEVVPNMLAKFCSSFRA